MVNLERRMENALGRLDLGIFLFSQNRLQPELQIAVAERQPLSLRAEGDRVVTDVLELQPLDDFARGELPQDHHPPQTTGRQQLAVGAEGDGGHTVATPVESPHLATELQVTE